MEVRGRDLCLFSHDASCLAVCGADGGVKIWDGATNQLVSRFSPGGARGGPLTADAWARQREHVSSRAKARLFASLRRSFSPLLPSLPFRSPYSTHGGVKGGGRRLPLSPPWQWGWGRRWSSGTWWEARKRGSWSVAARAEWGALETPVVCVCVCVCVCLSVLCF